VEKAATQGLVLAAEKRFNVRVKGLQRVTVHATIAYLGIC